MKPFNITAALNGEPVQLRTGGTAIVAAYNGNAEEGSVLIGWRDDGWPLQWGVDGKDYCKSHDIIGMAEETHIVNGFEVPAHETQPPSPEARFYSPEPSVDVWFEWNEWEDDERSALMLERGLVFATKEAAIANAKAMCGVDPNE